MRVFRGACGFVANDGQPNFNARTAVQLVRHQLVGQAYRCERARIGGVHRSD